MRDIILAQHEQITRSLAVNKNVKAEGDFDSIILAGMGGSGHPGDLINALGISRRPLYVHRNYDLPVQALTKAGLTRPLVICSSYSGNTEESLTAYQRARENNLPLLASAAGGTLKEWAQRDGVPFISIDFPDMQPRHTLLAAFTGIYAALRNSGLADNIDDQLADAAALLQEKTAALEAPAQALANQIKGKIPIFTSTDNLGFAAKNFKIQTNENAKYPAFWSTFPELNHNEMVGFSRLRDIGSGGQGKFNFIAIILHDPADHPRNVARMQVTADFYREWGVEVADFTAQGATLVEKIFSTVTFGLWTTFYLANKLGIDPIPVDGVENFKAKLAAIAGPI